MFLMALPRAVALRDVQMVNFTLRHCLNNVIRIALLLPAFAFCTSYAQNYPVRPVRVIVPSATGGGMDTVGRGLSYKLSDMLGQSFVVDNRPGAGSVPALEILAAAEPRGYTLLLVSGTTVVHPILYQSPYDIVRDFAPVSQVTSQGFMLVVHPSIGVKSPLDLVQYMRANPGKLNYASAGTGTVLHMSGELFQIATGTRMTHIPFRGTGAAFTDLVSGRVQVSFPTIISSQGHVNAGRLRALAVTSPKRVAAMPDLPTLSEAGVPGVVVVNWYGLIAPRLTPRDVIERIATETAKAVRTPEMAKNLTDDGSEGVGSSPREFAERIRADQMQWGKVIKQAGIRGE
jgi:tripartite-type tricarboxylate transporter receptor subunit TctC